MKRLIRTGYLSVTATRIVQWPRMGLALKPEVGMILAMADAPTCHETLHVMIRRLPGNHDVPLPAYQSDHAAGMDLHAAVPADQPMPVDPGRVALVPCGFAVAIPVGFEAQIRPRSGLATKHGIAIPNAPGTIDADYRGQVMVALINLGSKRFEVTRAMRIAQMIIKPVPRTQWVEVDQLPDTDRGEGGFGHTGH